MTHALGRRDSEFVCYVCVMMFGILVVVTVLCMA